ncbi:MAG: hypothetical protein KC656_28225, partial [Myxococcales bacterium]|nr:hypothetical protein [Myxococcales bacterium]
GEVVFARHGTGPGGPESRVGEVRLDGHVRHAAASERGLVVVVEDPVRGDAALFVVGGRVQHRVRGTFRSCDADDRVLAAIGDPVAWLGETLHTTSGAASHEGFVWDGVVVELRWTSLVPLLPGGAPHLRDGVLHERDRVGVEPARAEHGFGVLQRSLAAMGLELPRFAGTMLAVPDAPGWVADPGGPIPQLGDPCLLRLGHDGRDGVFALAVWPGSREGGVVRWSTRDGSLTWLGEDPWRVGERRVPPDWFRWSHIDAPRALPDVVVLPDALERERRLVASHAPPGWVETAQALLGWRSVDAMALDARAALTPIGPRVGRLQALLRRELGRRDVDAGPICALLGRLEDPAVLRRWMLAGLYLRDEVEVHHLGERELVPLAGMHALELRADGVSVTGLMDREATDAVAWLTAWTEPPGP